jgi:hypothetical protein
MKKKYIAPLLSLSIVLIACISLLSVVSIAYLFPTQPATAKVMPPIQDLREDKTVPFDEFLRSDAPITQHADPKTGNIYGISEQSDEDKKLFEAHRVKHEGGPIYAHGKGITIDGYQIDFSTKNDLRTNKTIPFREFIESDAPKTFFYDSAINMITGVSDAEELLAPTDRTVLPDGCKDVDSLQACMFGAQNYGIHGITENYGHWTGIREYRQYRNYGQFTIEDGTTLGTTYSGFGVGEKMIFSSAVVVTAVIIY